ncbi:MAG: AAA family ATPase, partial [bacterium]
MSNSRGVCVVIIGPAGSGKTTVGRRLVEELPDAVCMRTYTTREPRPGEGPDGDRVFISREEFERRRESGELIEWDEHFGHLYGSSLVTLNDLLDRHRFVVTNVNYVGARAYQERVPEAVTVFLSVPEDQIRGRIARRGPISDEDLRARLEAMKSELASASGFDYVVENPDGELDRAVGEIAEIA